MKIDGETLLCATIARPNRATKSPIMHNAGFETLGLNFVYLAFEPEDLKGAIRGMKALEIRGFSVSKPYKEQVGQYLDTIDPIAKKIGAINTILNEKGKLTGFNSDWIGAIRALEEVTELKNLNVAILGAGGAARAVGYGLLEKGSKVTFFNRTAEKGEQLAQVLNCNFGGNIDSFNPSGNFDILINATSVGFFPNVSDSPVEIDQLSSNLIILDAVFNPAETVLLQMAKQIGATPVSGLRMLVHQGVFQFELFTGEKAPFAEMESALAESLLER